MLSFRGEAIRFLLKHRHWFKGQLHQEPITKETDLVAMRQKMSIAAEKFAKIPDTVTITPDQLAQRSVEYLRPEEPINDQIILYFHGGGFVQGTAKEDRGIVGKIVANFKIPAITFDYALAPEHPFPAALDDAVAVYTALLEHYSAEQVIFMGDSAGGGLEISTALYLRDHQLNLPHKIVAFSPCLDMTMSGESYQTKLHVDPLTPPHANEIWLQYYTQETDPKNPYISPIFAGLNHLPPIMIQAGADDLLRDDSTQFALRAKDSNTTVICDIYPRLFHCFTILAPMFPEATASMEKVKQFVLAD